VREMGVVEVSVRGAISGIFLSSMRTKNIVLEGWHGGSI